MRSATTVPITIACTAMLLTPLATSWASAGAQTLRGTVRDAATRQPVALVRVGLFRQGNELVVVDVSDADGAFRLEAPRPGEYFLYAARDGYRTLTEGLFELGRDGTLDIEVGMSPAPVELEAMTVESERTRSPLEIAGFYDRVLTAPGVFLTRADIARSGGHRVTDALRGIPRIGIDDSRPPAGPDVMRYPAIYLRRGADPCSPTLYVDRHVVATGVMGPVRPDEYVSASDIEAIEVYARAEQAPAAFDPINNCGVVVIWTRMR